MTPVSATEVRNKWSSVCDDAIRVKPQFIKRTRDEMILSGLDTLLGLLEAYEFSAEEYVEDDGSITLALDQIDLAENAKDRETAIIKLAESICEYAEEYYSEYELYHSAPNRRHHLPYVIKALAISDPEKIGGCINCRAGKI